MIKKIDIEELYTSLLSQKDQLNELLNTYCDYVSFCRNFEYLVKKRTLRNLAAYEFERIFQPENNQVDTNWCKVCISPEDEKNYEEFIDESKRAKIKKSNCYITLEHIPDCYLGTENRLSSVPRNYKTYCIQQSLPSRIERIFIAYPKDEKISDASFIINGKYKLTYPTSDKNKTVDEVINNEVTRKQLLTMLEAISVLNKKSDEVDGEDWVNATEETLASSCVAPFENVMLYCMAGVTEIEQSIVKDLSQRSYNKDFYLDAGEKNGLINDASKFQTYQKIRNLLYHQWDTLDNIGQLNQIQSSEEKESSIRQSYIEAYNSLFDKSLIGRIGSHLDAAQDLGKLVKSLNQNYLTRERGENGESNSKFLARIKKYVAENPNKNIIIETNYRYNEEQKRESLIKQIEKFYPHARIVDNCGVNNKELMDRMREYSFVQQYLVNYSKIEKRVLEYSIFYGKPNSVVGSWELLQKQKVMTAEESARWTKYRCLRNKLCHSSQRSKVIKEILSEYDQFSSDIQKLSNNLIEARPRLIYEKPHIYRAYHKDGKQVLLNIENYKILEIREPNGTVKKFKDDKTRRDNKFIEADKSGIRFVKYGENIKEVVMPNELKITRNGTIEYPDGSHLYCQKGQKNLLVLGNKVKLIMDEEFKILKYIKEGRISRLLPNDNILVDSYHSIKIDGEGRLQSHSYQTSDKNKIKIDFKAEDGKTNIMINDGTTIEIENEETQIYHNEIKLTYANRREFAESYVTNRVQTLKNKYQGR